MGLVPRPLQAEDADEAGNEGWQARDLRKDLHCEGEACAEGGEGLPGQGPERQRLSCRRGRGACLKQSRLAVRGSAARRGGLVNRQDLRISQEACCECWPLSARPLYLLAGSHRLK